MTDAAEGRVRESFARQAFMGLLGAELQRVADDPTRPSWNADSFFKRFAQK